ncbi:ATP-binding protein [Peptacetobacter sp.]|uniref:ATP-binding protein n=1 Tax=Peptacetobacter sp. TaxID=2991975 RepID=UPI00260B5D8D|nr:sensor histidine kinase [Peptacetobacter sp.]
MLKVGIFWTIIECISTGIEWFVLKLILDEISERKSKKVELYISFLFAFLIFFILTYINLNANLKLVLGILIMCLVYFYNYNENKIKILFISLLYSLLLIGFDIIGLSLVAYLNNIKDMRQVISINFYRMELVIISKVLLTLLVPIFKIIKLDFPLIRKGYAYLIIPVFANIMSIIVIFGHVLKEKDTNNLYHILILCVSLILLFSNISLIRMISRIMKDNEIKIENRLIKEKMDRQYKHYLSLQESQETIKKIHHDIKNHMICIKSMYGNNSEVKEYIEDISNQIKSFDYNFNSKNMVLDIILTDKKYICDNNNIEFLVDINFDKCNFMDMVDVCSIFSNILDNAIEACNKIKSKDKDKKITLKGTVVNDFFVIKCVNTKENDVLLLGNKIMTDKKDKDLHGIGINSVKSSVKKYDGNVEFKFEEDKFIVVICIPIKKNAQLEL